MDKEKFLEAQEKIAKKTEEIGTRVKEANEAIGAGKGILRLETPIEAGEEVITELPYDLTALTGMEYVDAMDSDPNTANAFRITYRQGLTLFAKAAAKQVDLLDTRDIQERLGVTDAVAGVQVATLFFNASTRAGRLRISKR
ncbi:MAG: hypothetical protein Q4B09_05370 [Lachnospiraceae bacterium]|nr:hypothetical protein [Lachnospiraceae bacterium]